MKSPEIIKCDSCERDITSTSNCEGWRLRLSNDRKSCRGGAVTAMHISPDLEQDMHFCGLKCLRDWAIHK